MYLPDVSTFHALRGKVETFSFVDSVVYVTYDPNDNEVRAKKKTISHARIYRIERYHLLQKYRSLYYRYRAIRGSDNRIADCKYKEYYLSISQISDDLGASVEPPPKSWILPEINSLA